jgi:hypothetical protein
MKQPTPSDFIVNVEESNVSVIFRPTDSDYSFDRLTDPEDMARYGPLSPSPNVRHGKIGDTGDYPAEEGAQMAHSLVVKAITLRNRRERTPRGGQWYAKSVSNLLARHRSFHLIRQPVALLFLPALSKSLLLVAINSRQLTNSMSAFTSGGILSEYEFRSRHSTSQLSSPNAVPLNNVRMTQSHFSLLSCSRCVKAAFRSPSLSARSIWLASFCAGACDEARTHNRITNRRRVIRLSPLESLQRP